MNAGRRETQDFLADAGQAAAAAALDAARLGRRDAPGRIELHSRRTDGPPARLLVGARASPRCGAAAPGLVCVGLSMAEFHDSPPPPHVAAERTGGLPGPAKTPGTGPPLAEGAAAGPRAPVAAAPAVVGVDAWGRADERDGGMAAATGFPREEALGEDPVLVRAEVVPARRARVAQPLACATHAPASLTSQRGQASAASGALHSPCPCAAASAVFAALIDALPRRSS